MDSKIRVDKKVYKQTKTKSNKNAKMMNKKEIRRRSLFINPNINLSEDDERRKSTLGLPLEKQRFSKIHDIKEDEEDISDTLSLLDMLNEEKVAINSNQSLSSLESNTTTSSNSSQTEKIGIKSWPKLLKSFKLKKRKQEIFDNNNLPSRRASFESALELEVGKLRIKEQQNFDQVLFNGFRNEKENKPTIRITLTPKIAKDDINLKKLVNNKPINNRFLIV